jgi:plasminogen activator inhibitor 1 RNA-binding protein
MTRETEEGLKLDETARVPEKQVTPEDVPQVENKDNKDAVANEEEEKEEDKVYFLQDMFSEYSFL